jgi:hypothetical protein
MTMSVFFTVSFFRLDFPQFSLVGLGKNVVKAVVYPFVYGLLHEKKYKIQQIYTEKIIILLKMKKKKKKKPEIYKEEEIHNIT